MLASVPQIAVALLVGALAVTGCGPQREQTSVDAGKLSDAEKAQPVKVLTIGMGVEPKLLHKELGATGGRGVDYPVQIVHNRLTVRSQSTREIVPQLASENISVPKGTWRVNPDGTMDTIWKIRPNIKWHDGTPFTSSDLLFSFTVLKDPETPAESPDGIAALKAMQSASAPDPHTFAVHWSQVFATADDGAGLEPMAQHLLEETYSADKANFKNSPRLRDEFVGLGPYRLLGWELGSHMELGRFDDYFLGRPPLDKIIIRFFTDPNAAVTNILSGAVDLVTIKVIRDIDAALEMRRRWEGTGNRVGIFADPNNFKVLEVQHRPELARPQDGLTNVTVRRALYQAIDRKSLADYLTYGLSPVADSWYSPQHELRAQLEASVPQFPYDPSRAQRLLDEVGWVRGPDGVRSHPQTGERFVIQIQVVQPGDDERIQAVVRDDWQRVGVEATQHLLPPAFVGDRKVLATHPGVSIQGGNHDFIITNRLHSRFIGSEDNRWLGANRSGYKNPQVDVVLDKLVATIDPTVRLSLHKDLLREQMENVALMPLYWHTLTWAALAAVQGVEDGSPYNVFEWNKI